jgi:hypothetical protein
MPTALLASFPGIFEPRPARLGRSPVVVRLGTQLRSRCGQPSACSRGLLRLLRGMPLEPDKVLRCGFPRLGCRPHHPQSAGWPAVVEFDHEELCVAERPVHATHDRSWVRPAGRVSDCCAADPDADPSRRTAAAPGFALGCGRQGSIGRAVAQRRAEQLHSGLRVAGDQKRLTAFHRHVSAVE